MIEVAARVQRRRYPRARRLPALREPVRPAASTAFDRAPAWALLGAALVVSGGLHLLGVGAARGVRPREELAAARRIRVALVERPAPPKPPPEAPPEAPKVVKAVPKRKPLAPSEAPPPVPAEPSPLPPPPHPETPLGTTTPVRVQGCARSSTTGSMGVGAGDGVAGSPRGSGTASGEGAPSKGKPIAPAYALTEQPIFLDNVSPEKVRSFYPEDARKAKLEGVVRAQLLVDDDGSVARVTILGDPGHGFAAAAAKVARLYRFKPARVNGRPVATEIVFTIRFELE
jgi:protein TonB